MVDMNAYWPVVFGVGVGTLLIRYSFILIMDKVALPDVVHRLLRFIPASVLPALIAPAVFLHKEGGVVGYAGWERTVAVLAAVLVAWKTRSVFGTIAAGMTVLWVLQAVA